MRRAQPSETQFIDRALNEARASSKRQRGYEGFPPAVGAVVAGKDGRFLKAAHRSEDKDGEHAEYFLLERKLGDRDLSGATLYTTLEPCIHVRKPRKTDCAVWVAQRQIERVVVGMADPDTRVCGQGIRYLRERGIRVDRFDFNHVEEIAQLDRGFLEEKTLGSFVRFIRRRQPALRTRRVSVRLPIRFRGEDPDASDLNGLVEHYINKRQVAPEVHWPSRTEALWVRALYARARIVEAQRFQNKSRFRIDSRRDPDPYAHPQQGHPFVEGWGSINWWDKLTATGSSDFVFATDAIRFAWMVRTYANRRIPHMWRGVMPCWDDPRRFVEAVRAYLKLCNTEVLFALSYLDESGTRALFREGHRWHKMRAPRVYQAAFQQNEPFCKIAVTALGDAAMAQPALEFYVPRAEALREWDAGEPIINDDQEETGRKVGRPKPSLYHSWIVPQTEFLGIGEPKEREVKYGDVMDWRRIESDRGTLLRGRPY